MRQDLFEQLGPICPVCSSDTEQYPLSIGAIDCQTDDHIVEGQLLCENPRCRREYPIIDGIPLLIRDLRSYLANNEASVLRRDDLSLNIESVLGDCTGPSSAFNSTRQQLSSYVWDHYGDFDPSECNSATAPGSMLNCLRSALDLAEFRPSGDQAILDLGCGPGRSSFEMAQRFNRPVLGIDLHYPMLKIASALTRDQNLCYSRRKVGLVYERCEFNVKLERPELVDFWACDATALPFKAETFSAAISLNLLDCIHSPIEMLMSLDKALVANAPAIVACPYDWSESATSVESWLGGHSQRTPDGGSSEAW